MKKYYFTIASILLLVIGLISCSNEDNKAQTQIAARPSVPINVNTVVRIGTQVWMTQNLNVDHYRNGDPIPQVTDAMQWVNLTTGAWCYYENNLANGAVYGKLYNWYAINDPRGLAPRGWHVPSSAEWNILKNFVGDGNASVAGGKMKEAGTIHWLSPNTEATNSSGFTALPGGSRSIGGTFNFMGAKGNWWSSTQLDQTFIQTRELNSDRSILDNINAAKVRGFSVRCIKN